MLNLVHPALLATVRDLVKPAEVACCVSYGATSTDWRNYILDYR